MRKPAFLVFCIILCLACISCSKDFRFKDFTETNVVGELLGPEDPDDWRMDDDWGNAVHKLFDDQFGGECTMENKALKDGIEDIDIYRLIGVGPAFPNPAVSTVIIDFSMPVAGKIQVLLVDGSHHVLLKKCIDVTEYYNYTLNADISDIDERGELYRIFYKYISETGTSYGHGDILIE